MWRYYQQGKRVFSGVQVGDGLTQNQRLPQPILTPTTKEESDREITPAEIVSSGLCTQDTYQKMQQASLALFHFGSEHLAQKGITLVDTKYEFGLLNGAVILIDEIHTPDSSRFWRTADYEKNPLKAEQIDKEFVRQWLIANKAGDKYPDALPAEITAETTHRYLQIYEMVTGTPLEAALDDNARLRIYGNLVKHGIIKAGYVALIMGSPADEEHANTIRTHLKQFDIMTELRVVSAHKNGEAIAAMAEEYNNSIEPGAVIAIAGRSNGLGGALSANLNIPVINCPPFKDNADVMVNLASSMMMPSNTPAVTVIHPDNAAFAALRALNISSIRTMLGNKISEQKQLLAIADARLRNQK
jgi:phosphoribosylaminoimidazole carboxylase PurE protein